MNRLGVRDSLRLRLTVAVILVVLLLSGIGTAVDYRREYRLHFDQVLSSLEDQARALGLARKRIKDRDQLAVYVDEFCALMNKHVSPGHHIVLLDSQGNVLVRSQNTGQAAAEQALLSADPQQKILSVEGRRLAQFRLKDEDGVIIIMAQYLDHLEGALRNLLASHILNVGLMATGIIVLMFVTIHVWAIRHINKLKDVAKAWSARDFSARANPSGPAELRFFSDEFNAMAEELQRHEQNQMVQLEQAKNIQVNLLPTFVPPIPGMSVMAEYWPLEHVAGDLYDFFELPNGTIGVAILDVAGHGVSAALLTGVAKMSLRYRLAENTDLAKALEAVNGDVLACTLGQLFITAYVALWDPLQQTWTYAAAGHQGCTLIVGAEILHLNSTGPMLGIIEDAQWSCATVQLSSGNRGFLYTDGVIEAGAHLDKELGTSGLEEILTQSSDRALSEQVDLVLKEVVRRNPAKPTDDTTIVAFEVL